MEGSLRRAIDVVNFVIRKLVPADAEEVREARLEGLKLHPDAFSRDYEQDLALAIDDWRRRLDMRAWFGGFEGDALLGIAAFGPGDSSKTKHSGHLGGMYVREKARGTGMAEAIIRTLLDHAAKEVEQVQLTVNADNRRAFKLYERCGFREVGRVPRSLLIDGKYYDEITMLRDLREGV
jgi:RimJ/RimL family protein N-acetyltransferase